MLLAYIISFWLLAIAIVIVGWRHELLNLWREPVYGFPILVIESDDWGPGESVQAQALIDICNRLKEYRDCNGRMPVVTLGLTLAIPDSEKIQANGFTSYERKTLLHPEFSGILSAIKNGEKAGVFYLQLHGMEHYWPPALMRAQEQDASVRSWMTSDLKTENLPSHLQSRWSDGSTLPSGRIDEYEIENAARDECRLFAEIFGKSSAVAVPPTFDWGLEVERAWMQQGIRIVITPGLRMHGRDNSGKLLVRDRNIFNGQVSVSGVTYLVRNNYFEPARGHRAAKVVSDMQSKTGIGRPLLLEMHRDNFYINSMRDSIKELSAVIEDILKNFPDTRFMNTEELISNKDIIETEFSKRVGMFAARLRKVTGLQKWLKLTGTIFMLGALELVLNK